GDRAALVRVLEGIEHVERRDDVECAARKRRRRDARAREMAASFVASDAQAGGAEIEPVRAAERAEPLEVCAGAAPAVEDERRDSARGGGPDERGDERAKAAEPEVPRLRSRGRAQQMFHARIVSFSRLASLTLQDQLCKLPQPR